MKSVIQQLFIVGCWLLTSQVLLAQEFLAQAEDDPFLSYDDEELISIATGTYKPLHIAPSVATVITAKDIEVMGARNLDDILEYVPGLHVSISWNRHNRIYSMRGIHTDNNPHLRLLINGHSIDSVYSGGKPELFRLNIANISRIEIIRGPGSAVYGADAVSGVVNIITKNVDELAGATFGVRAGAFHTHDFWVQHGGSYGGWETAFSFEYSSSDGDRGRVIDSDLQTIFDGNDFFGAFMASPASLAARASSTGYEQYNTSLKLQKENWAFWLNNWRLHDAGIGPGVAQALDPVGRQEVSISSFVVNYNDKEFAPYLDLDVTASFNKEDQQAYFKVFPDNALLPVGDDGNAFTPGGGFAVFPDGYLGNPGGDIEQSYAEIAGTYSRFDDHLIRLSLGMSYDALVAKSTSNFGPGVIDGTTLSTDPFNPTVIDGALTDTTGTPSIYIPRSTRRVKFLSIQDEWRVAPDWELTAGARYDDYSDFGGTTNPRLALVWATDYNLTTKFLYGRAFRALSFNELYIQNNPVNTGNPALKPEEINVAELVFDYRPTFDLGTVLNMFRYDMNNIVEYVGGSAQNKNDQDGYGLEFDVRWDVANDTKVLANYAWQHSKDSKTGEVIAKAPVRQASFALRFKVQYNCLISPQLNWVADRKRDVGDSRVPVDDYTLVDLTARCNNILKKPLSVAAGVHNLTDTDAREPSPYDPSLGTAPIENDFPLEGRSVYIEASYRFDAK